MSQVIPDRKLRVVVWSTGTIGRHAIAGIDAHPDLELVGVWVSNPDKDGKDATITVQTKQGDLASENVIHLRRTGKQMGLFDKWSIQGMDLGSVQVQVPSTASSIEVNGKSIDVSKEAGTGQTVRLPAFFWHLHHQAAGPGQVPHRRQRRTAHLLVLGRGVGPADHHLQRGLPDRRRGPGQGQDRRVHQAGDE